MNHIVWAALALLSCIISPLATAADPVTLVYAVPDEPPAYVAARIQTEAQVAGMKWIRTVSLQEDTEQAGAAGLVVYFCDIPYMARAKEGNPYAGVTGPFRAVILPAASGSRVVLLRPTAYRSALDGPDALAALEREVEDMMEAATL